MKFNKREFKIRFVNNTTETVKGYVSEFELFGVHINDYGNWVVTHLRTGNKVYTFTHLKRAKKFIELLEVQEFPVNWDQGNFEMTAEEIGELFKSNLINSVRAADMANNVK